MARISELHYSNGLANTTGIAEFVEVSLSPGDAAGEFAVALYQADGTQGLVIRLSDVPGIDVFPPNGTTNETVFVLDGDVFDFAITDPDGGGANNFEAIALVRILPGQGTGEVVDFYDIGGGTQGIIADDGIAQGAQSETLPVETLPNQAQGSLQFNQPDPGLLVTAPISRGTAGIPCFVAGTLIDTPWGVSPVEDLKIGEYVITRDKGALPLRWIGRRTVRAEGAFAPIVIAAGHFGATRDLAVSPQHRVLLTGAMAELLFGEAEVLVPAKHLVDGYAVQRRMGGEVTYYHLLFDDHELVTSNGAVSESFHPSGTNISGMDREARDELLALFPQLAHAEQPFDTCRTVIRGYEARALSHASSQVR
ncbi:MAG: Hint domain-containing protein [Pseudomonadota bacterium]